MKLLKIGLAVAGMYVLAALYLIATQGLFGESFIAITLGLPWSWWLALLGIYEIDFGILEDVFIYVLILGPMVLNVMILYWLGSFIQRRLR